MSRCYLYVMIVGSEKNWRGEKRLSTAFLILYLILMNLTVVKLLLKLSIQINHDIYDVFDSKMSHK